MAMTDFWGFWAEPSYLVFPFNSDLNSTDALKVFTKWEEVQEIPSRRIRSLFHRETSQLREDTYRLRWNVSMNVSLAHADLIMALYNTVRGCGDNFYWYDIMRSNFKWDNTYQLYYEYLYLVRFDNSISRELQEGGTRVVLTFSVVEVSTVDHGG